MKKYIITLLMVATILLTLPHDTVSADMGPKPSVVVSFEGIEEEPYYVTLLSKDNNVGPWSTNTKYHEGYRNASKEVWEKFKQYQDVDGFSFIGFYDRCTKNQPFRWGYYPPAEFKILVYLPKQDKMIISKNTYTQYAFDSYYTCNLTKEGIAAGDLDRKGGSVLAEYPVSSEIGWMLCRIAATIVIELIIAWFFGYRKKNQVVVILLTNLVTQTVLNIIIHLVVMKRGSFPIISGYFWVELLIVVMEGFLYQKLLSKGEETKKGWRSPWSYSIVANVVSFLVGVLLSGVVPQMF